MLCPHPFVCVLDVWADAITSTSGRQDSFEMILAIGLNKSVGLNKSTRIACC